MSFFLSLEPKRRTGRKMREGTRKKTINRKNGGEKRARVLITAAAAGTACAGMGMNAGYSRVYSNITVTNAFVDLCSSSHAPSFFTRSSSVRTIFSVRRVLHYGSTVNRGRPVIRIAKTLGEPYARRFVRRFGGEMVWNNASAFISAGITVPN